MSNLNTDYVNSDLRVDRKGNIIQYKPKGIQTIYLPTIIINGKK